LRRIAWITGRSKRNQFLGPLSDLVGRLAKKKFVMTSALLKELFEIVPSEEEEDDFSYVLTEVDMVGFAERSAGQQPLSPECC